MESDLLGECSSSIVVQCMLRSLTFKLIPCLAVLHIRERADPLSFNSELHFV